MVRNRRDGNRKRLPAGLPKIVYVLVFFRPVLRPVGTLIDLYCRLTQPAEHRYIHLDEYAMKALQQGDFDKAKALASELLDIAPWMMNSWNYGNAIHNGHQILGLVCLRTGDTEGAKKHLLKAGATPGSPQLNSYGPKILLARELLEAGERDAVLVYLDRVARFWAKENRLFSDLQRENAQLIRQWKQDVRKGKVPQHKIWL